VRKVEAHYIQVDLAGQHTRGYTAVDRRAQMGREPNVNLVLEIDMKRFWELMQAAVQ
jgi:inosine-uridine nucleoside N-ribohydrolase